MITPGSRAPVAGLPTWVTLEVLKGGCATEKPMVEGTLEPDGIAHAARLGLPHTREAASASYLTDEGLRELGTLVGTGGYEVRIPEDGILLVVAHLALSGDRAGALELLENVRPLINVLRFMPRTAAPRTTPPDQVSRRTAAEVREHLEGSRPRPQVETQQSVRGPVMVEQGRRGVDGRPYGTRAHRGQRSPGGARVGDDRGQAR